MVVIFQGIIWSIIGVAVCRKQVFRRDISSFLAKALYWIGVPLQIFFLARNSEYKEATLLPMTVSVLVLFLGLGLTLLCIGLSKQFLPRKRQNPVHNYSQLPKIVEKIKYNPQNQIKIEQTIVDDEGRKTEGSYILSSILGNTGFIGLALVPALVDRSYWSWIVLYGISHNVLGSYGLGALIAEQYSDNNFQNDWIQKLKNLLFLPSLWGFVCGYFCRDLNLPFLIEFPLSKIVLLVVPGAFLLIGMRLSKLQQWQNLRTGIIPALCKVFVLPLLTGLLLSVCGFRGDERLVFVLMAGMPTAFASIILSEAFNLDRSLAANSVLISTLTLPVFLLFWLRLF